MSQQWDSVRWEIPERNPAHADPNWFQLDLDDEWEDPDTEPVDLFPTERHWRVPDDLPTWTP